MLGDIKNPRVLYFKGILFLVTGIFAAAILLLEHPEWRTALLLGIAVWAFCRAYYFAFYVLEHYVDPNYKFAGLTSLWKYWREQRLEKEGIQVKPTRKDL